MYRRRPEDKDKIKLRYAYGNGYREEQDEILRRMKDVALNMRQFVTDKKTGARKVKKGMVPFQVGICMVSPTRIVCVYVE